MLLFNTPSYHLSAGCYECYSYHNVIYLNGQSTVLNIAFAIYLYVTLLPTSPGVITVYSFIITRLLVTIILIVD